jgi:hypothetical protein
MKFKLNYFSLLLLFMVIMSGVAAAQTPANNATGVSVTTNFTFANPTAFASERLQIATDNLFASIVLDKTLGAASTTGYTFSSADLTGALSGHTQLNNDATYYWRLVDVTGATLEEPLSGFYTFMTILGTPTASAATSITSSGFSANWNSVPTATSYILRVGTTTGGTDVVNNVNVGNVLTYPVGSLSANTTYYYSVEATDGTNTTSFSNEISPTTLLGPPTATSASSITSTGFVANWTANVHGGATSYILRVGTTSGGTDVVNDLNVGNVLSHTVSGLLANTQYYYSVKATDGINTTVSSNEITATTLTAPVPLTAPSNGLTGVSVLPTFTWSDIFDETTFTVKVSTVGSSQAAFDAAVFITQVTAQNATSYATLATDAGLPLSNGTIYYWQVSVQGGASDGVTSAIYHFTTSQTFAINLTDPTGIVYTPTVDFIWTLNSPLNNLQFIVQYKYDTAPPTNETFWSGAGFTSMAPTGNMIQGAVPVLAGKTYYWRVLAQRTAAPNDYIYYPVSTVYGTFSTAGGSTVAVAASWPTGGNTVYTNAPTLYWYLDQYVTGLTYEVDYVQDNSGYTTTGDANNYFVDFNSTETHVSTGSGNLFYVMPSLTPGTKYWWKVRAYDASTLQYSSWSSPESFVTAGVGTNVVPVPSYPVSGETIYTTSPTFYWYINSASSGLYYDVDISTDPNFASSIAGYPHTTLVPDQMSESVTNLTPGLTYYWRVRSNNLTTVSAWSEVLPVTNATFTVAGGSVASYPVASWPIGATPVVYTPTPTLNWYLEGSPLGLTKYTVKWYHGSGTPPGGWTSFNNGGNSGNTEGGFADVSPVTTTNFTIPVDLTYGLTYYWAVAAYDGTSYSTWSEGSFSIIGGSAGASVVLSQPEDGSTVYNTSQTLFWYINGSTYGISSYELQYSQSDQLTPLAGDITGITNQYQAISGLVTGATYYWKVKATYIDGTQYTSPTFSFTVNTGSPSIVQPHIGSPNHVQINTDAPMLSWALPAPSVNNTTYELMVANNPNFTDAQTISSSKQFVQLSSLASGSSYFWKVRSKDGSGNTSNFSSTGQFTVGKVTAVDKTKLALPTSYSVSQNYPNPFNPTTNIEYALPKSSVVSIKVYNMLGQEVKTLISQQQAPGYYNVQWNGDNNFGQHVSSGIYIYRVTAGQYVKTMKMVMLK